MLVLLTDPQPYSSCDGNSFAALPGSCNQYMHCQWGKYDIRECAPGLHWNNVSNLEPVITISLIRHIF